MGLTVLVDDRRSFADGRDADVYRRSQDVITELMLKCIFEEEVDELWLDHDLGEESEEDISAVVRVLEEYAVKDRPLLVGTIYVHSANPSGADSIVRALAARGYNVKRVSPDGIFIDKDN